MGCRSSPSGVLADFGNGAMAVAVSLTRLHFESQRKQDATKADTKSALKICNAR